MKRYMVFVVPFFAMAACGADGDSGDTSDTTTPSDTNTPDNGGDTTPTPGVSAITGVNYNVSGVTEPARNEGCPDDEIMTGAGVKYPWGGIDVDGTDYTCNKCPMGLADFQGMFRAFGGSTDSYEDGGDADTDDAELLYIDGNTWYTKLHDHADGSTVEARGWFVCTQKPEHPNEHLFWVVTDASNNASGDFAPGGISESDVILSQGANEKLIFWYDGTDIETGGQHVYCKIGSTKGGQTCNNPFE